MNAIQKAEIIKVLLVVLAAVALAFLLVCLVAALSRRRKKKKELAYFNQKLHQTMRNDILDKAIQSYHKTGDRNYWLIKVLEVNQFGEREYFYNLSKKNITIGRDFNENSLCVFDESVALKQCQVVYDQEVPSLLNVSNSCPSVFNMKNRHGRSLSKNHAMRTGELIKLHTYDSVSFGETKLIFFVYNNIYGLI